MTQHTNLTSSTVNRNYAEYTSTNYGSSWIQTVNTDASFAKTSFTETLVLQDNPSYREILKKGQLVPHGALTVRKVGREYDLGTFYRVVKTNSSGSNRRKDVYTPYYGIFNDTMWEPTDDATSFANISLAESCLQRASGKAYSSGSVDGLTFLAEFAQVKQMFIQAGKSLMLIKSQKYSELLKQGDSLYLAAQFGWRPFISDMQSLAESLKRLQKAELRLVKGSHSMSEGDQITSYSTKYNTLTGLTGYREVFDETQTVSNTYRASVQALMKCSEIQADVAITAYEMTRFSFLVDYFFTVGAAISAAHLNFYAEQVVGSYGVQTKVVRRRVYSRDQLGSWYITGTMMGSYTYTETLTRRIPAVASVLPRYSPNVDAWKIANMIALASVFLR